MNKRQIILSSGSIPWLGLKQALNYSIEVGYDGLEVIPTRRVVKDIENAIRVFGQERWISYFTNIRFIKSIHQNWRLDIGQDKEYRIKFLWSLFFNILRLILFPSIHRSSKVIGLISEKLNLSVTVHDISQEWTHDKKEFSGGISLEIIGEKKWSREEIAEWLVNENHKIVVDTRDDQSLLWAKNNGFNNWKSFWEWIGLIKIGGIQLTLIGAEGLRKILKHKSSTAEEQFLWLNKQKWNGVVTIEVNPFTLFCINKGKIKQGLQTIAAFVRQTLVEGRKWSN